MSNMFNNQNTQEQSWQAIAHQLAYAIKLLEEDASNMKNWHKAFRTLDKYEEKAKDNETIQRDKFGKFTFEPLSPEQKSLRTAESRAFKLELELIKTHSLLADALLVADTLASHLSNVLLHDPAPEEIVEAATFLAKFILNEDMSHYEPLPDVADQ